MHYVAAHAIFLRAVATNYSSRRFRKFLIVFNKENLEMKMINKKYLTIFLVFFLTLFFIGVANFIFEESQRTALIERYRAPSQLINFLKKSDSGKIGDLLAADEILVCSLNSYADANSLTLLNEKQRESIPKTDLPSEDMMWYLIFFDAEKSTRIFLFEKYGNDGFSPKSTGCFKREGVYKIVTKKTSSQQYQEIIFLTE